RKSVPCSFTLIRRKRTSFSPPTSLHFDVRVLLFEVGEQLVHRRFHRSVGIDVPERNLDRFLRRFARRLAGRRSACGRGRVARVFLAAGRQQGDKKRQHERHDPTFLGFHRWLTSRLSFLLGSCISRTANFHRLPITPF